MNHTHLTPIVAATRPQRARVTRPALTLILILAAFWAGVGVLIASL